MVLWGSLLRTNVGAGSVVWLFVLGLVHHCSCCIHVHNWYITVPVISVSSLHGDRVPVMIGRSLFLLYLFYPWGPCTCWDW